MDIYKVYRVSDYDDCGEQYVKYMFLYENNIDICKIFIEKYVSKIKKYSPYYDALFIVKNIDEINYCDEYLRIQ